MMMTGSILLVSAALLISLASYAGATVKVGPEFRVNNSIQAGSQQFPTVATLADGGFVVTWAGPNDTGIFGRRFTQSGASFEGDFRVDQQVENVKSLGPSSVAGFSVGGFVFSWVCRDISTGKVGFAWLRYTATGLPVGNPHCGFGTSKTPDPVIASTQAYRFVILWHSVSGTNGFDVYGQNSGGTINVANTTRYHNQRDPAIAGLPNGRHLAVWQSFTQDGSGYGIFGQDYNGGGEAIGYGEFRANTFATGDQTAPAVAWLRNGGYVVTWQSVGQDGSGDGVYAQRYYPNGFRVGMEFRVNTTTFSNQFEPSVAGLSGGGFVITWTSQGQDGSGYGVYGQVYNSAGQKDGGEFRVNNRTFSTQWDSSVAALPNNQFAVVWSSYGQDGDQLGIYGQRFRVQ